MSLRSVLASLKKSNAALKIRLATDRADFVRLKNGLSQQAEVLTAKLGEAKKLQEEYAGIQRQQQAKLTSLSANTTSIHDSIHKLRLLLAELRAKVRLDKEEHTRLQPGSLQAVAGDCEAESPNSQPTTSQQEKDIAQL